MQKNKNSYQILVAEDDPDDQMLLQEAFEENDLSNTLTFCNDGAELLEYLKNCTKLPDLILLDLNMPRKDGREVLAEVKSNPDLKFIPVIVFTTSSSINDVQTSYQLGVNSYVTKPVGYKELQTIVSSVKNFWLNTAILPSMVSSGYVA